MCGYCDKPNELVLGKAFDTTQVSIFRDEAYEELMKIRCELGSFGHTFRLKINYCPICGRELNGKDN